MNDASSEILGKIDELIESPRWLIDPFPRTVPRKTDNRYFAVEELLQARREELDGKFYRLLLKLYCYYDFWVSAGEETAKNPPPDRLASWIIRCFKGDWRSRDYLNIILPEPNAMVILNGDDLYMILCNPDGPLLELAAQLAAAEGLFLRRAPEF